MLQTQGLPSRSSPLSGASHLPKFQWETPGYVYSAGQHEHLEKPHIRDLAAHPTPSGSLPGHTELSGCKYTAKPSSWPAVGSLTPVSIQRHASLSLLWFWFLPWRDCSQRQCFQIPHSCYPWDSDKELEFWEFLGNLRIISFFKNFQHSLHSLLTIMYISKCI